MFYSHQSIRDNMATSLGIQVSGVVLQHKFRHSRIKKPERIRLTDFRQPLCKPAKHLRCKMLHHLDAHAAIKVARQLTEVPDVVVWMSTVVLWREQFNAMERVPPLGKFFR